MVSSSTVTVSGPPAPRRALKRQAGEPSGSVDERMVAIAAGAIAVRRATVADGSCGAGTAELRPAVAWSPAPSAAAPARDHRHGGEREAAARATPRSCRPGRRSGGARVGTGPLLDAAATAMSPA